MASTRVNKEDLRDESNRAAFHYKKPCAAVDNATDAYTALPAGHNSALQPPALRNRTAPHTKTTQA